MSLRSRLTVLTVLFLAISLLLTGLGLYTSLRTILLNGIQQDLRLTTERFQQEYNVSVTQASFAGAMDSTSIQSLLEISAQEFAGSPISVEVYKNNGVLVNRTQSFLAEGTTTLQPSAMRAALDGNITVDTLPLPRGGRLMQVVWPLQFQEDVVGVVVASQSLRTIDRALDTLIWVLLVSGGVMLVLVTFGIDQFIRRALRPIDQITSTAEQIVRAEDLSRRVPVTNSADELGRLGTVVNGLLARLESLFNTQRRLIADVSHELRTPLAAMRGNLEVLQRGAMRNPALLSESLTDIEREASRLTRLVNDLLLLAQSEAGVQIRKELVELDTLVLEVFREIRPLAEHVRLQLGSEDQATVIGDRDRLKQALLNLAYNAIQHTPDGGTVTLNLECIGREASLSVQDTGEGIGTEELPHIFERFYRADRSRVRKGGGAGIGLAIVRWIAEAHRGSVTVRSTVSAGSTFIIWLPLATPAEREQTRQLISGPLRPPPEPPASKP